MTTKKKLFNSNSLYANLKPKFVFIRLFVGFFLIFFFPCIFRQWKRSLIIFHKNCKLSNGFDFWLMLSVILAGALRRPPRITPSSISIILHKILSLRKHTFLLALRHWGRFARRNVCDSATEIPYWWRKICPESGQKRWLVEGVVTLF